MENEIKDDPCYKLGYVDALTTAVKVCEEAEENDIAIVYEKLNELLQAAIR